MQPRPRVNAGASLLGRCPPVNEPVMQRMPGPLLQAPYELLPAPSSVERMEPLRQSPPLRSAMQVQSRGGFRREQSPPRFITNSFFSSFRLN